MFRKLSLITTVLIIFGTSSAFAQTRGGSRSFGLGVSTVGVGVTTPASITAWLNINEKSGIQGFLGVGSTSGGTGLGLGALYKINVVGNAIAGVHIGGGLRFGSEASTFFFDLVGNGGVHFSIPSLDQVYFAFDAGPVFALAGPRSFNFSLTPYSILLGASIIYMF